MRVVIRLNEKRQIMKRCTDCQQWHPRTGDYYSLDGMNYSRVCMMCESRAKVGKESNAVMELS